MGFLRDRYVGEIYHVFDTRTPHQSPLPTKHEANVGATTTEDAKPDENGNMQKKGEGDAESDEPKRELKVEFSEQPVEYDDPENSQPQDTNENDNENENENEDQ